MSRFCIICGTLIVVRYSVGRGHNIPTCKDENCIEKYLTEFAKKGSVRVAGFCGRCGKPMLLSFLHSVYRHMSKEACDTAPCFGEKTVRTKKKREKPPVKRVYLKPWKDPQSLFCSPKLGEIVGKKIPRGVECSGSAGTGGK